MVLTVHSLEPLRPWKREQLGYGYDCSSWVERTAIEMADAVIAVSEETKRDVLRLFNIDQNHIRIIYTASIRRSTIRAALAITWRRMPSIRTRPTFYSSDVSLDRRESFT